MTNYTPLLIGSGIGLTLWLINVGSIENVLIRNNDQNVPKLTLNNLILYAKLPFDKPDISWPITADINITDKIKLLSLNWIVMFSLGLAGGYIYQSIF